MTERIEGDDVKIIHVNAHIIKENKRKGERAPPLTVRGSHRVRGDRVDILIGGVVVASVVYQPDNPLTGDITAWVETRGEVVVHNSVHVP